MLLRTESHIHKREKDKTKQSRRLDLWISLAFKGLSHTELLGVVKDEEKMHTDDSVNQNSRHATEYIYNGF